MLGEDYILDPKGSMKYDEMIGFCCFSDSMLIYGGCMRVFGGASQLRLYMYIHQEKERVSCSTSYTHHDPQPRMNYIYIHFAWPAWRIVFQVGINKHSFKENQLIRDPR